MASILDKLKKNSTVKETAVLTNSIFFNDKDMISVPIPILNVALSGSLMGGLTPGLTMWAGPSKHFKTSFSLLMAKAYLDKYPEAVLLFYDSEFGTPQSYFKSFGIDTDRVVHTPIVNIEVLKHDLVTQMENLARGDKVIVIIDSIGNLASKKELEDALEGKSVADMTRAKQLKSLFRMVTPYLTMKNIPLVVVNHTYKEIALYPKDIVGGGTGSYYSSDNIFILGRQQEKDGDEIAGYSFIINVEKSRFVKEKSKIPVTVMFDGGISKYSGIFDLASESGHIVKAKSSGYYQIVDTDSGELSEKNYRKKEIETDRAIMEKILADKKFNDFVISTYRLAEGDMIQGE